MFEGFTQEAIGTDCRVEILLCEPGDPLNIWLEGTICRVGDVGVAVRIDSIFQESLERLKGLLEMSGPIEA